MRARRRHRSLHGVVVVYSLSAACSIYDQSQLQGAQAPQVAGTGASGSGGTDQGPSAAVGASSGTAENVAGGARPVAGTSATTGGGDMPDGLGGMAADQETVAGAGGANTEALTDITSSGVPIALIMSPKGMGNISMEVLRNGDMPAEANEDPKRQYDTYAGGGARGEDWLGYQFEVPHTFARVLFQNGIIFFDGGWFESVGVQVEVDGQWSDVESTFTPAYPGASGSSYAVYQVDFPPTTGTSIRVFGTPGGTASFVSSGELRVFDSAPIVP